MSPCTRGSQASAARNALGGASASRHPTSQPWRRRSPARAYGAGRRGTACQLRLAAGDGSPFNGAHQRDRLTIGRRLRGFTPSLASCGRDAWRLLALSRSLGRRDWRGLALERPLAAVGRAVLELSTGTCIAEVRNQARPRLIEPARGRDGAVLENITDLQCRSEESGVRAASGARSRL
jgi:hypothetical protein